MSKKVRKNSLEMKLPIHLDKLVDIFTDNYREQIEKIGFRIPIFFLCNQKTEIGLGLLPPRGEGIGCTAIKIKHVKLAQDAAVSINADFSCLIARAWIHTFGMNPSEDPSRKDVVMFSIETPEGCWQATSPVDSSAGGFKFETPATFVFRNRPTGPMSGILTCFLNEPHAQSESAKLRRGSEDAALQEAFNRYVLKTPGFVSDLGKMFPPGRKGAKS